MLFICPVKKEGKYVYEGSCAITSCMFHAKLANGGCVAQHSTNPSLEEIAYYRGITQREATTLRTHGRAGVVRVMVLYRYSNFCLTKDEIVPQDTTEYEIALAILSSVIKKQPFCIKAANISPNLATLAKMFQEENLEAFAQTITVKKKLNLRWLLDCTPAEIEAVQQANLTTRNTK